MTLGDPSVFSTSAITNIYSFEVCNFRKSGTEKAAISMPELL